MRLLQATSVAAIAWGLGIATVTTAIAQQPPPAPPANKAAKAPAKSTPGPTTEAPKSGEAALRQRIEQLEEQLTDMQVAVGTLDSLGRGGAPSAQPSYVSRPSASGSDGARVEALEGTVRALGSKLDQLMDRVRMLEAGAPAPRTAAGPAEPSRSDLPSARSDARAQPATANTGFGSVTVAPEGRPADDITRLLNRETASADVGRGQLPAPTADGGGKQLYEQAYGYMLQQDYAAAEGAFTDFLQRYGNDPLAGNAQYWLGETHFVRGQFKPAAAAFLKGYQTYARSQKAPDSLLKLALSLHRLGQKDAACASFDELNVKFPTAPAHIKNRALAERQRAGC